MSETSSQRVARMLSIVTYVHKTGTVEFSELAKRFDVSETQLKKDLDILWCSGLPGYAGGDLIEVEHDGDLVQISNVEHMGITQPLRLSAEEGVALLAGINALAQIPGIADAREIQELRDLLTSALGEGVPLPDVHLEVVDANFAAVDEVTRTVQEGLAARKRLKITYVSNRDEITEREVDPLRIIAAEGYSYLRSWCYRAGGERLFRIDRISRIEILDVAAAEYADLAAEVSLTPHEGERVTLEVTSPAQWILSEIGATGVEVTARGVRGVVTVGNSEWFESLLLSLGADVIAVDSKVHRERAAARARRALARYENLPTP